jgi:hypothetical protein
VLYAVLLGRGLVLSHHLSHLDGHGYKLLS